jgi:hypothetical protein
VIPAGSLFILPDRTWVGASSVSARYLRPPFHRPGPEDAPRRGALATVRLDRCGRSANQASRFSANSPLLGLLTPRKLNAITVALKPSGGMLVATSAPVPPECRHPA